jgi:hypothetical protein
LEIWFQPDRQVIPARKPYPLLGMGAVEINTPSLVLGKFSTKSIGKNMGDITENRMINKFIIVISEGDYSSLRWDLAEIIDFKSSSPHKQGD